MTENQTIQRGKDAQAILDSEVFKDAMGALKDAIDDKRAQVSVRDPQGLVIAALWERIHRDFKTVLEGFVQNGSFTAAMVDMNKARDETKPRQFMRRVTGY